MTVFIFSFIAVLRPGSRDAARQARLKVPSNAMEAKRRRNLGRNMSFTVLRVGGFSPVKDTTSSLGQQPFRGEIQISTGESPSPTEISPFAAISAAGSFFRRLRYTMRPGIAQKQ